MIFSKIHRQYPHLPNGTNLAEAPVLARPCGNRVGAERGTVWREGWAAVGPSLFFRLRLHKDFLYSFWTDRQKNAPAFLAGRPQFRKRRYLVSAGNPAQRTRQALEHFIDIAVADRQRQRKAQTVRAARRSAGAPSAPLPPPP
ncbi:hypothetical protein ACFSVK_19685 [Azorhizophilus paspali]|uniref:YdhG-like domain-containing protein n=1 Tax=Azorhizophilus paspali TaxID=69963 RepID=A0ABV6ST36_AZOPA